MVQLQPHLKSASFIIKKKRKKKSFPATLSVSYLLGTISEELFLIILPCSPGPADPDGGVDASAAPTDPAAHLRLPAGGAQRRRARQGAGAPPWWPGWGAAASAPPAHSALGPRVRCAASTLRAFRPPTPDLFAPLDHVQNCVGPVVIECL